MPLSDTAVRNAKPGDKQRKMDGKEKTISIGTYPETSLKKARSKRDEYRTVLADGGDPSFHKKVKKQTERESRENSFEAITREWLDHSVRKWALRHIESTGAHESAHRTHQNCGQVLRFAIATGRAERDPAADLKSALIPAKTKHHASITDPVKVGELLRTIENYQGEFITKFGLQLAPLLFVHPGELRHAEWSEIDLELAEWHITAEKVKMPAQHIVPFTSSSQAEYKLRF
ncbi:putative protein IntB [Artemia franciscana]|uniref:putative protein IntB n=1 Tax=Artemia franciscana TaxID=6661 RepID=UPI0032D9E4C0